MFVARKVSITFISHAFNLRVSWERVSLKLRKRSRTTVSQTSRLHRVEHDVHYLSSVV